jgi:hypothetical protein
MPLLVKVARDLWQTNQTDRNRDAGVHTCTHTYAVLKEMKHLWLGTVIGQSLCSILY